MKFSWHSHDVVDTAGERAFIERDKHCLMEVIRHHVDPCPVAVRPLECDLVFDHSGLYSLVSVNMKQKRPNLMNRSPPTLRQEKLITRARLRASTA
jgi:hypothetical protein